MKRSRAMTCKKACELVSSGDVVAVSYIGGDISRVTVEIFCEAYMTTLN